MTDTGELLTARDKGIPARAIGLTIAEFLASAPRLDEFWTPLVVLDDAALTHNLHTMVDWCAKRDIDLAPHGKTTMAPALWRRQLEAGAAGITLATMGQVRTGRALGLERIMLANAAVDARSLQWLATELADPAFPFTAWADSVATVEAMEQGLGTASPRPVDVCVELGAPGGRTGARTVADAVEIARRIDRSPVLRLAGVAGYEGSLGHDRRASTLQAVRAYLDAQLILHEALADLYDDGEHMVTAGGSAYPDVVAEAWAGASRAHRTRYTLRAGAYLIHDDGFYRGISPFDEGGPADGPHLQSAMHGYARVVSHPEPELSLVDAGKRDLPFDEGLPIPRAVAPDLAGPWHPLEAVATAMNDQHTYLRGADAPDVRTVVRLGLSHPCTAFDKWRVLPLVDSRDSNQVVGLVRTYF